MRVVGAVYIDKSNINKYMIFLLKEDIIALNVSICSYYLYIYLTWKFILHSTSRFPTLKTLSF